MRGSTFLIIRGIIGIAIGILAVTWPGITIGVLVGIIALFAFFDGISNLLHGLFGMYDHSWETTAQGVVGIAAGLCAAFWPGITLMLAVLLLGGWAMATGVFEVVKAISMRDEINGAWQLALGGLLSLVFGFALIAFPLTGVVAMAWMLGIYAAARGVALLALGVELHTTTVA